MNEAFLEVGQFYLVPVSILFTALGVARTEALKTLISLLGLVMSALWLISALRMEKVPPEGYFLIGAFLVAALISTFVHVTLWAKDTKTRPMIETWRDEVR
jgi:predicted exporter